MEFINKSASDSYLVIPAARGGGYLLFQSSHFAENPHARKFIVIQSPPLIEKTDSWSEFSQSFIFHVRELISLIFLFLSTIFFAFWFALFFPLLFPSLSFLNSIIQFWISLTISTLNQLFSFLSMETISQKSLLWLSALFLSLSYGTKPNLKAIYLQNPITELTVVEYSPELSQWNKFQVVSESIIVVKGIGIQLTCTYGDGSNSSRFISCDDISAVVINEAISCHSVFYYLAFIISPTPTLPSTLPTPLVKFKRKKIDFKGTEEVILPFENLFPRLPVLQELHSAINSVLFDL
eukprot:Sdes_comp19414_c0_seq1m10756